MSRWAIAEWVGPTGNRTVGGMVESRGLVLHIMQGSYDGSIAWGKNPASSVSFHFATRGDGHLGQLVDTADAAWTQAAGNGHWISVENEGYSGNPLTAGQLEACAQIYAEGVRIYGWPLQTTDSPNGHGLGWHGMGGTAWGGHFDCPGEPIKAQRGFILDRAQQILGGDMPLTKEDVTAVWQYYLAPAGPAGTGYNLQDHMLYAEAYAADANKKADLALAKLDQVLSLLEGGVTVDAKVDLTDEAVAKVADATADEIAADPERDGRDT